MSQKLVAPAGHFYGIPDSLSLSAAALIEPLAVAWHAVSASPFRANDSVLVIGGGPIGIGIVQVLSLQGAKQILVSEIMSSRQKLSLEFGATRVLDPRSEDVGAEVRAATGGAGADVVFDAAGVEKALLAAIPACRAQGTIVNIAVWAEGPSIPVNQLMYREIRYMGAALYDEGAFTEVIEAISSGMS